MNTVVGWLGLTMIAVTAFFTLFAPLDDLLISWHWTVPLAFVAVGLILVVIDEWSSHYE